VLHRRLYEASVGGTLEDENCPDKEKILAERKSAMIQSDKGTEFLNSIFQSTLERHDVKFYTSENEDIKATVVERFNRTLE
jgi:hypothetical protein